MRADFANEYYRFFMGFPENCTDMARLCRYVKENSGAIMRKLRVCKFEVGVKAVAEVDYPMGIDDEVVLYDSGKTVGQSHKVRYRNDDRAEILICAGFYENEVPDRDLIEAIEFISKQVFLFISRARTISILTMRASLDSLTGIPNVPGLRKYSAFFAQNKKAENYSMVIVNLKAFAYTNQLIGQDAGDVFLAKYAKYLQKSVADDDFVARLGGDNFIIIMRKGMVTDYLNRLNRYSMDMEFNGIIQKIEAPIRAGIYNMVSSDSVTESIPKAFIALNTAKNSADESFVFFQPYMMEREKKQKYISSI